MLENPTNEREVDEKKDEECVNNVSCSKCFGNKCMWSPDGDLFCRDCSTNALDVKK